MTETKRSLGSFRRISDIRSSLKRKRGNINVNIDRSSSANLAAIRSGQGQVRNPADAKPHDSFQPTEVHPETVSFAQLLGIIANQGADISLQHGGLEVADTSKCKSPQGESKVMERFHAPLRTSFGESAVLDLRDSRLVNLRAFHVDKTLSGPLDIENILGQGWKVHRQNDYATSYQIQTVQGSQHRQRITVNRDGYADIHSVIPEYAGSRTVLIHTISVDRDGQCLRNENWKN